MGVIKILTKPMTAKIQTAGAAPDIAEYITKDCRHENRGVRFGFHSAIEFCKDCKEVTRLKDNL